MPVSSHAMPLRVMNLRSPGQRRPGSARAVIPGCVLAAVLTISALATQPDRIGPTGPAGDAPAPNRDPAPAAFGAIDSAGIRPDDAYYGFRRSMPMTVDLGPPSASAEGSSGAPADASPAAEPSARIDNATIVLYDSGSLPPFREIARSPVRPMWADPAVRGQQGSTLIKIDFNQMFPALWTAPEPAVMLAQLEIDGVPRGSPLVLQPLMAPVRADRVDRGGMPVFVEPENRRRTLSGVRVWTSRQLVLDTTLGAMVFSLHPEHAPNTVWHIMSLVRDGFYTDIPVHRVASLLGRAEPDIVQAGDPLGNGLGGPGFSIDLEPSKLPHDFGVMSLARAADPNSNGSQFFICLNRDGTRALDGKYASFARLVRGEDVLLAISKIPVGADERPLSPPVIRRAWLADAPPRGSEPPPAKDPFAPGTDRGR